MSDISDVVRQLRVTDNTLVTPADYDPFCITAAEIPAFPRRPGSSVRSG